MPGFITALVGIVLLAGSIALLWALGPPVRRLPRRGQVALAFVGWMAEALVVGVGVGLMAAPFLAPSPASQDLLAQLPFQAIAVLAVAGSLAVLACTWRVPSFADVGLAGGPGRRDMVRDVAFGLLLGPLAVGIFLVAGLIGGWDRIVGVAAPPALLGNLALGALFFFLTGVLEELSTRGCLFALLARAAGLPIAAAVSVVLFALLHLANPGANLSAVLGVGLAGAVFLWAFLRSGALWLPIAFHWSWDWAETSLYGFPDSGIAPSSALQLAIDPQAPAWATGGQFGPEASLFALIALALVAGAIWLYTRGRSGRTILFPRGTPESTTEIAPFIAH